MQENEIKVSVGLIVYNHEKYLREAIESILMQEVNFKYEIIVGEDNSTDKSREILLEYKENYPDKFILIFQEQNVGGTKNIYDVFVKARGKYIACLEGDDYWIDNKKLQKQFDFLENNNEYLGVSHVIEARDLDGNYIFRSPSSHKLVGKDATIDLFLEGYYFSGVATVFRNIFLDKSNDYSIYYKAHKFVGDLTLCMLLLDKGKIKVLDEVMSVYRCRRAESESNYNSITSAFEQYSDHIHLLNAINEYFKYKYDFSKEYVERSTNIFFYFLRHGGFGNFHSTFETIPQKARVLFYILLPWNFIKALTNKSISMFKNKKH